MRCPECNKFVSLELQEPEMESSEFDEEAGLATAEVTITRCCADCGTELKQAALNPDGEFPAEIIAAHEGDAHVLDAEFGDALSVEEKVGRKTVFGAAIMVELRCKCQPAGADPLAEIEIKATVAASEMDELT